MTILVYGGSGSGKSEFAEQLITKIKKQTGFDMYYIATMKVYDDECQKRIEKHRRQRRGKGFITLESPTDLKKCIKGILDDNSIALLECISNLVANEMFTDDGINDEAKVVKKVKGDVKAAAEHLQDLVIVTNNVFDDGCGYGDSLDKYISAIGKVNLYLASVSDEVYEVIAGIPIRLK